MMGRFAGWAACCFVLIHWGFAQSSVDSPLSRAIEPRFATVISVREPVISMRDLIRRLARETRLDLRVADAVRDRRVCIVVGEQPLDEVLTRLAVTFGFGWTRHRERDGQVYYLLSEPSAVRSEREQMTRFLAALREKEPIDLLQESLARVPAFAFRLSYEEHRQLLKQLEGTDSSPATTDPRLRSLLNPQPAPTHNLQALYNRYLDRLAGEVLRNYYALHLLGTLSREEQRRLRQQEQLRLPPERLPEEALQVVQDRFLEPFRAIETPFQNTLKHLQLSYDDQAFRVQTVWEQRVGESGTGTIYYTIAEIPLSGAQQFLNEVLDALKPETPSLPALTCRMPPLASLEVGEDAWIHLAAHSLSAGAQACRLNLVAEWSPLWLAMTAPKLSASDWASVLASFGRGYVIQHEDKWLTVSLRAPALARALDISEAEFRQWLTRSELIDIETAVLIERRLLDIQVEALRRLRLAWLPYKQARSKEPPLQLESVLSYLNEQGVVIADPLYDSLGELLSRQSKRLLRFYGSLPTPMRAGLKRGIAVPLGSLPAPAQAQLLRVLGRQDTVSDMIGLGILRLEPSEIPLTLTVFSAAQGDLTLAHYMFPEERTYETARVGKSPFARGCRFVIEFPSGEASTRQLRFPLHCSL